MIEKNTQESHVENSNTVTTQRIVPNNNGDNWLLLNWNALISRINPHLAPKETGNLKNVSSKQEEFMELTYLELDRRTV